MILIDSVSVIVIPLSQVFTRIHLLESSVLHKLSVFSVQRFKLTVCGIELALVLLNQSFKSALEFPTSGKSVHDTNPQEITEFFKLIRILLSFHELREFFLNQILVQFRRLWNGLLREILSMSCTSELSKYSLYKCHPVGRGKCVGSMNQRSS